MVIGMIKKFKSFGVLAPRKMEVEVEGQIYKYLSFQNANGVEWQDLVAQFGPFDFYIAITDEGRIVSMESDPDASQIADMEIIGINVSEDFNYTNGPGGTIYGKVWDGATIKDPDEATTPEEIRAQMPDLERWRVNTIIDLEPGLREKIDAAIDAMPEPQRTISKNKLADVQMFSRTDPLFDLIGSDPSIGKTPEDIDAMWQAAASLV